jgi:uncharacterized membrane protein
VTPWIFSAAALGEIVNDKVTTGSRKAPPAFIARIVMGALSGAAIGAGAGKLVAGIVLGAAGAVLGTLGGSALRARLAKAIGRDLPAALIEDAIAIVLAILAVRAGR